MADENILIVDDSLESRTLIKRILEAQGYVCHVAAGGEEALGLLETQPVDLALLDILMPGMTGLSLFERIKERYPGAAVVFVTAMDDLNIAVEHIKNGAYDYVVKPVTKQRLLGVVSEALANRTAKLNENKQLVYLEEEASRQATELEGKKRELTSLNDIFQAHLNERFTQDKDQDEPLDGYYDGQETRSAGRTQISSLNPSNWLSKFQLNSQGMTWAEAFRRASHYFAWVMIWGVLAEVVLIAGVMFLGWGLQEFEGRRLAVGLGIGLLVWGVAILTATSIAVWIKASTDAVADSVEKRTVARQGSTSNKSSWSNSQPHVNGNGNKQPVPGLFELDDQL